MFSSKILNRESNIKARWIRESSWIKKTEREVMNRDEGIYNLRNIYDSLITSTIGNKSSNTSLAILHQDVITSFPPVWWIITTISALRKKVVHFSTLYCFRVVCFLCTNEHYARKICSVQGAISKISSYRYAHYG